MFKGSHLTVDVDKQVQKVERQHQAQAGHDAVALFHAGDAKAQNRYLQVHQQHGQVEVIELRLRESLADQPGAKHGRQHKNAVEHNNLQQHREELLYQHAQAVDGMGIEELRGVAALFARDDVDGCDGGKHAPAQPGKIAVFQPVIIHKLKHVHAGQVEHLPKDAQVLHHGVEYCGIVGYLRIEQHCQHAKKRQRDRPDQGCFPVKADLIAKDCHSCSPPFP